jgi:hypothetical protein
MRARGRPLIATIAVMGALAACSPQTAGGTASVSRLSVSSATGGHAPVVNGRHVFWGLGTTLAASPNNLVYHGGLVETVPATYIVYWGPAWQSGFSFQAQGITYTQATAMSYVQDLLTKVGGTAYAGVQTQYCQNIAVGSVSCVGDANAKYITNPAAQLKGTWIDPTPVPADIATTSLAANVVDDPVAAEAVKAAQHFGYDVNATYLVFTEPGHPATAYGAVYCAYHSETSHTTSPGVRYSFMPYVPEQGANCGQNNVNLADDAYGHGYYDGYSIVTMHEVEEAVTDPANQAGIQDGWNDAGGSENGDKCSWTGLQNVAMGSQHFALQPLWSNEANGGQGACAFTR